MEFIERFVMSLLVVGSVAFDTIESPSGKVEDELGGSAIYFSAGASLFSPVRVVAVVGNDFDMKSLDFLSEQHVDLEGIYMEEGETFRWGGKYMLDVNERETIFTHLNVFENFNPVIPESYRESEYVFLANIDPELQQDVLSQVKNPEFVVMDTMNHWINEKRDAVIKVLKNVDGIILNDSEVRDLSGEHNLIKAAQEVSKLGPELIIVKKGEHGAFIYAYDSYFFVPAYPLADVQDPTGAGDSFAGGFMGYIAQGGKLRFPEFKKGLVFGTSVASFCVEQFGLGSFKGMTRGNIEDRAKQFMNMIMI